MEQIEARFAELSAQMSDPDVIGDRQRYADAGRALPRAGASATAGRASGEASDDAAGARELLDEDGDDPELRELLAAATARLAELEEEIRLAMVAARSQRRQERDHRGAGRGRGRRGRACSPATCTGCSPATPSAGGCRPSRMSVADGAFTFAVKGKGAYSVFKHEGGTHRVQRVPETESQGRIHTSTATVAVLPEAEDVDVDVQDARPADRRLPLVRPRGPVGQHHRLGGPHHP